MKRIILTLMLTVAMATTAMATHGDPCDFDINCLGGKCVKGPIGTDGVCVGGL